MDDVTVVELAETHRHGAIATLVAAFVADPVERWLYPEASAYLAHFGRFVEAFAGRAFATRSAWGIDDLSAVSLWSPPGTQLNDETLIDVLIRTVAPSKHADVFAVAEQMDAAHPSANPHWYLALLGVDPAVRDSGCGSRLLEAGLRTVDAEHQPAYLETPNPHSVALYERFGFVVSGRVQAGRCPPMVSMVRAPR